MDTKKLNDLLVERQETWDEIQQLEKTLQRKFMDIVNCRENRWLLEKNAHLKKINAEIGELETEINNTQNL